MRRLHDFKDWNEFEKQMLKQFPFLPKHFTRGDVARNASWVNDFVQKAVDQYLKHRVPPFFASGPLRYELLETHRSIIARIQVPEKVSPYDINASVNRNKLRIVLPSGEKQEIRLSKPVYSSRARAKLKDNILEVRMPKIPEPKTYHNVYVED